MNLELLKLASRFEVLPSPEVWTKIGDGDPVMSLCVEVRGKEKWVIKTHNGLCLDRKLEWDYEPLPSSRTDERLSGHRFSLTEALILLGRADLAAVVK